jgi:hypothetical protein
MNKPEKRMEEATSKSWWDRNWKWLVPTGCLTGVLLFAAFVGGLMWLVLGLIRSSQPYEDAFAHLQSHPALIARIGEPIEPRFWLMGSVETSGPSGTAELSIPVSGPEGKAVVYVSARKSMGEWSLLEMVAELRPTEERIEMLSFQEGR